MDGSKNRSESCGRCTKGAPLTDRHFRDGRDRVSCSDLLEKLLLQRYEKPVGSLVAPRINTLRLTDDTCSFDPSHFSPILEEAQQPAVGGIKDGIRAFYSRVREIADYYLASPRYNR